MTSRAAAAARRIILALATVLAIPVAAHAQSFGPNGTSVNVPALPATPAFGSPVFTTSCTTPATPQSCPAGSAVGYGLAAGAADVALQLLAVNGGTFSTYASLDGVNYFPALVTSSGFASASGATAIATPGIYNASGSGRAFFAIVATTAPTTSTTLVAYLGSHGANVHLLSSVPIASPPIGGPFTLLPIPSTNGTLVPQGPTGTEFVVPPGATLSYTCVATAPTAAPTAALVTIVAPPVNAGSYATEDRNLTAGTACYVTAATNAAGAAITSSNVSAAGAPFYRTI